ncbi:zinc-binding dehydrogenase [Leptotrichia sp. oral taxon 223]|nr:zinc-binding dehydrogenase [Leptotrichia sp. oral taxon 223]
MKAVVLEKPCTADELKIQNIEIPKVKEGWVLIKIKAFGINRAEIFTRNGFSPSVKLPRVIGIECVGVIEDASDSDFKKGDRVFTMMNGLGREFNGSYAEYTLVPSSQVYPITISETDWTKLAAYPELYYTAYGSLFKSLKLKNTDTLLIRGGTSSVALASIQLAKSFGNTVIATSRSQTKAEFLKEIGADFVLIQDDTFDSQLRKHFPDGIDKVLDLIGTPTLKNSLKSVKQGGIVCMTGCLGGWVIENFEPLSDIPSESYLTSFDSTNVNRTTIKEMFDFMEKYNIKPRISKIFTLDEISLAHQYLESNSANGKVIVKTL